MEVEAILKKACWKNEETFRRHYKRDIVEDKVVDFNVLLDITKD